LEAARKIVDPGNTFLTVTDPEIRAQKYKEIYATYYDMLISELGYSPEKAARYATPITLYQTLSGESLKKEEFSSDDLTLLHSLFLKGVPYGEARDFIKSKGAVTSESPTTTIKKSTEPTTRHPRATEMNKWIARIANMPMDDRISQVKEIQRALKKKGMWTGPIDGKWNASFVDVFKNAYMSGVLTLEE